MGALFQVHPRGEMPEVVPDIRWVPPVSAHVGEDGEEEPQASGGEPVPPDSPVSPPVSPFAAPSSPVPDVKLHSAVR